MHDLRRTPGPSRLPIFAATSSDFTKRFEMPLNSTSAGRTAACGVDVAARPTEDAITPPPGADERHVAPHPA